MERKHSIVARQLREYAGAESAVLKLVEAGCDRHSLYLLLVRTPPAKSWAHVREMFAPSPKTLQNLGRRLESAADDVESKLLKTGSLQLLDLATSSTHIANDLRLLAGTLKQIAIGSKIRLARRAFSYKRMGRVLPATLLCYYVRKRTGRPHFVEIASLLSATQGVTITEGIIGKRANRAIAQLTLNGKNPALLELLLKVLASIRQ